jgi:hypothetical protein
MAKVLGPLFSQEARGRVGGLVYNTWRGLHTVKTHIDPEHEDDPLRQAHKNIVTAAGKRWQTISAAQRAAWDHYATQHLQPDWSGTPVRLAGFHWYVRIQTVRQDCRRGYNDDPPGPLPFNSITSCTAEQGEFDLVIAWNLALEPIPGLWFMDIWKSKALSAGRSPTIHDATRCWLDDAGAYVAYIEYPGAGTYTFFYRLICSSGIRLTWAKIALTAT